MVNICLNIDGSQVPFLSIPDSDVPRLSIRPFKWLRYVMFSICGARGDLSTTPGGPPVDYGSTSLADIIYYSPLGNCIFVDYEGLNERLTSTGQTSRRHDFRKDVIQRDGGSCVITQELKGVCDAVHLIRRAKGDKYIERVVQDRSSLYDPPPPPISGINDVQNRLLLRADLHGLLAGGKLAFLRTPNYGLEPTDIPRVDLGPARTDHITLQQLEKPGGDNPTLLADIMDWGKLRPALAFPLGGHVDAQFRGTGNPLPPAIILDYVYGVAAYRRWMSGHSDDDEVHSVMKNYRGEYYADIPLSRPPSNDDDDPSSDELEGDVRAIAMDEMNSFLMSLQPQKVANRRKEEELKVREASRSKVEEWLNTTEVARL